MDFSYVSFEVIQSIGISIGMGTSTLAILNFFHAISDGTISETERNFMGITYTVLRVAMGIILVSTTILMILGYFIYGADYFTHYVAAQAFLVLMLFANAALMTFRIMPSTFGPAIQASTWYTLGFIMALLPYIAGFNLLMFGFAYATFIFFAISFVNAVMAYLKDKLDQAKEKESAAT
jgi:hypothetical protein